MRVSFKLSSPYQLVSEAKEEEMALVSMPVITFSKAGFSSGKDRALVYVSYGRDMRFKKEHYVVLNKRSGSWRIERKLAVFVP